MKKSRKNQLLKRLEQAKNLLDVTTELLLIDKDLFNIE